MSRVTPFTTAFEVDEASLNAGAIYRKIDGSLWKIDENGDPQPLSGSGSQTVKAVDLGVIDFASIFTNGPRTLYTLQAGEYLRAIRWTDEDYVAPLIGGSANLQWPIALGAVNTTTVYGSPGVGTVKSFGWYAFASASINKNDSSDFYYLGDTDTVVGVGGANSGSVAVVTGYGPDLGDYQGQIVLSASGSGPIQASFFVPGVEPITPGGNGNGYRLGGIKGWQANTAYDLLGTVVDASRPQIPALVANGTVWYNTGAAGTSGGSVPDFAGNAGGTVADGPDIVWSDQTTAPLTAGAQHGVAEIWTPAAP